ncbi:PP2C family protein-serine/threonine phosphatase [Actinoplanes sp. NPDC051851]|uniref:PP2C family protein-serine/threonine phosphatase n=1 Tax=Actinoplanes sp. NPDC051851 TaxID=3154753 RepID=UPI00342DB49C
MISRAPAASLLEAAFDAATEAMLLCTTADDTVLLANTAARALVPGLPIGGALTAAPIPELAAAVAGRTGAFRTSRVQGIRRELDEDHYAWYLGSPERDHTAFLAEAGRRLSASLNLRRVSRATVELAATHLADAAVVILPARHRRHAWTRLIPRHAAEEGTLAEHRIGDVPGLAEALGGFPPVPSRWLDAHQIPGWLFPAALGPMGALLVIPLPGSAEPAGALILARSGERAVFEPDDEVLARIFAARAGAAISAAALYREQADTAAILQADLLPPELPRVDGFELAGSYQSARDAIRVGGDFYDAFGPTEQSPDTVIALGDVCGTGPEAAVLTGKVRQTLRALRLVGAGPEAMLRVLNQALLESPRQHRFVTLVVGSVSRADHGRVRLRLASGGHPAPLILRADGTVEEVATRGTLIGAVRETVVHPAGAELAPGEICLLYSDGLTEARGGPAGDEQYGETRLRQALASCAGIPVEAVLERIRQLVSDWVHGGVRDDIAMLAVRAPTRTPLRRVYLRS